MSESVTDTSSTVFLFNSPLSRIYSSIRILFSGYWLHSYVRNKTNLYVHFFLGDIAAATALQQEIIKNAGNGSVLSKPQSEGASVDGTGGDGGVKVFTTDSPIVKSVNVTLPGENIAQGSVKDFMSGSSAGGVKKGEKEKVRDSDKPQITYATRQKKKKST